MLTKRKSRIVTTILAVAILATMFVGYANAMEGSTKVASFSFWMSAPGGGGKDTASLQIKDSERTYADFYLYEVSNSTGKEGYLNVRASDKTTVVGRYPAIIGDDLSFPIEAIVLYASGYGNPGSKYCPSCQSSSSSTAGTFYIEGRWVP